MPFLLIAMSPLVRILVLVQFAARAMTIVAIGMFLMALELDRQSWAWGMTEGEANAFGRVAFKAIVAAFGLCSAAAMIQPYVPPYARRPIQRYFFALLAIGLFVLLIPDVD
jgi:hypothetical protein